VSRPRVYPLLALGLVLAAGLAGTAPGAEHGERPVTRVGVRGDEFNLVLSRTKVDPGPAVVQFQNVGEDPHDLKLQRQGSDAEHGTGELGPGEFKSLPQIWMKRGARYRLWCSLENHVSYGMEATLRVRQKRRRR
jgi:plastocyanin